MNPCFVYFLNVLPAKSLGDLIVLEMPTEEAESMQSLRVWGKAILRSVLDGKINPEQGKTLMALIESQIKTVELADLSQRMAAVEEEYKLRGC